MLLGLLASPAAAVTLAGTAYDASGNPMPEAAVEARVGTTVAGSATTDAAGLYRMDIDHVHIVRTGDTINFYINGAQAVESIVFDIHTWPAVLDLHLPQPVGIPEFPTIALPVVAVLGLVFFFHKRKK